jgi:cardiolipin synthase
MIDQIFGSTWAFAYLLLTIGMVVLVLIRKREPSAALGWSLVIVLLPAVGALLFLSFGTSNLPRRLRRKVEHRAAYTRPAYGVGKLAAEDADADARAVWASGRTLLDHLGAPPLCPGNDVELLSEGREAFERMFRAIEQARHHVHIEMYIFRYDKLGRKLIDLLVRKCKEGVEVRLLVDYAGTLMRWRMLRRLRNAGGEGAVFLPLFGKRFAPNLRNHRKVVICDGRAAFFGGLNVGEEYLGRHHQGRDWCDLHVRLEGPGVADVQAIFVEDWDFSTGRALEGEAYFPEPEVKGEVAVRIVAGGPDQAVNLIREAYFFAITRARERLYIATPYVVPDAAIRDALASVARSGVDVRLITQGEPPDNRMAELAGSYYFEEMLEAGIRIFRFTSGMMHAKFLVADDTVAAIGSANLDNRSLALNFEMAGVFPGAPEVAAIATCWADIEARCTEVTLDAFRQRSGLRRVGESLARLFAPLL